VNYLEQVMWTQMVTRWPAQEALCLYCILREALGLFAHVCSPNPLTFVLCRFEEIRDSSGFQCVSSGLEVWIYTATDTTRNNKKKRPRYRPVSHVVIIFTLCWKNLHNFTVIKQMWTFIAFSLSLRMGNLALKGPAFEI
jgi:hypothetical protein